MTLLCIDLYCGLGGWSEGFLAEGYVCRGYDIEAHDYGTGGYPGTLIMRDVRSIHGSEFKDATVIVASPPCQAYSYRAMPWSRAKALPPPDNELFNACFRIQREASEAAGHHIPLIVENVRGAQKWVGRARWHYGSFYLWGDVPALMPMTFSAQKFNPDGTDHGQGSWFAIADSKNRGGRKTPAIPQHPREDFGWNHSKELQDGRKHDGSGWTEKGSLVSHNRLVPNTGVKLGPSPGKRWEDQPPCTAAHRERSLTIDDSRLVEGRKGLDGKSGIRNRASDPRRSHGNSDSRKAASAMIAKIPFPLSSYIARHFKEAR